jgi:hypothetical protein
VARTLNEGPFLWSEEHKKNAYLKSEVKQDFIYHSGRLHLPVAYYTGGKTGPSSKVIQVSQPRTDRKVCFHFIRSNAQPVLPPPKARTGEYLMDYRLTAHAPKVTNDGQQRIFEVEGWYLFAQLDPLVPGPQMTIGKDVQDTLTKQAYSLGLNQFSDDQV